MAAEFSLKASPRRPGHPRRDRAAGLVPAVVYGHGVEPAALSVDGHELGTLLSRGGARHLLTLAVEGEDAPRSVVVKEIQQHPVTRQLLHVDFQAVSVRERIHAEVPLRFIGEAEVARAGGMLEVVIHHLRISCLPADLPDHAEVDVSHIGIGQSLLVRDVPLGGSIVVLNDAEEIVAHVAAPRAAGAEAGEAGSAEAKA